MRRVVRLLAALVTCVLTWILMVPAVPAAAAPAAADTSYAYDTPCNAFVSTETTTERGPPVAYDTRIAKETAEGWPGALCAANDRAIPPATSNYDVVTTPVHTDDAVGSTERCREPAEGHISAPGLSRVATNTEAAAAEAAANTGADLVPFRAWPEEDGFLAHHNPGCRRGLKPPVSRRLLAM